MRFASSILPAWARKSPQVSEVLPLLYLYALSTSDFVLALDQFLGSGRCLSASVITRLTRQWQVEAKVFKSRSLADVSYVYVWVDGIHVKVRLEQNRVCLLEMVGVRANSRTNSWPWLTGCGRARSRRPTCCAIANASGCAQRGAGVR
jgi:transposase-like protein